MTKNSEAWNAPVWELASRRREIRVRVEVSGTIYEGTFVGLGPGVVSDEEGNAQKTIAMDTGRRDDCFAENSRVLGWGRSSWRNLVVWHVLRATARCSGSAWTTAMSDIMVRDEGFARQCVRDELPRMITFDNPTQQASLLRCVRGSLLATLRPFRKDEAAFACELLVDGFGGDAATYLETWKTP